MVARSGASNEDILLNKTGFCLHFRDVTAGATGATGVTSKFSDALTLFQPSHIAHIQKIMSIRNKNLLKLALCQVRQAFPSVPS
jgi:hypothetical protein